MRIRFTTTLEENLISKLRVIALQEKVNTNDVLEKLIEKYLNKEIKIDLK